MKNTNIVVFFFALTLLAVGCKEREASNNIEVSNLPSFSDYYKLVSKQTDGKIIIQSTVGLGSQHELRNNSVDTYFDNSTSSKISRASLPNVSLNGANTLNNYNSIENTQKVASLFGTSPRIEISESLKSGRSQSAEGEVYIPELLTIQNKIEFLREGDQITWNADSKNTNGVTFKFEYKPQTQSNKNIAEQFNSNILNAFIVSDNGKLVISNEMISKFPNGGDISLIIARGNMDFINNSDATYSVGGVTAVYTRAKIVK